MRPSSVLVGASVVIALGLSTYGVSNAGEERPAPTPPPNHRTITEQLNDIESKLDKLLPPTTTTTTTTTTTATVPVPVPLPKPPSNQTLGVGGVPTPPNAKSLSGTGKHSITVSGLYDCHSGNVGWIEIKASNVTVQNCKVVADSQYGIYSLGENNTIQNNDIKGLKPTGDGDLNAITFFGSNTKIRYNTAIDFVAASDAGGSHTDGIQTWNTRSKQSSSNVEIRGNRLSGPLDEKNPSFIHQCIMAQGAKATDGGGGGKGPSHSWLVADNYCVGDMKFDDIDNVSVTRNEFAGADKRAVVVTPLSTGFTFYADNKVGSGYGDVGAPITTGAGPK